MVVAGPGAGRRAVRRPAGQRQPGAFEVTTLPDGPAADRALRDRQAYAAFVLGPTGPALHTAPGAAPAVAGLLTEAAASLPRSPLPVVEVVPADRTTRVAPASPPDSCRSR